MLNASRKSVQGLNYLRYVNVFLLSGSWIWSGGHTRAIHFLFWKKQNKPILNFFELGHKDMVLEFQYGSCYVCVCVCVGGGEYLATPSTLSLFHAAFNVEKIMIRTILAMIIMIKIIVA